MKYVLIAVLMFFCSHVIWAQQQQIQDDDKYREDQFYVGLTYNYLAYRPQGIVQRGFSKGIQAGFLRDTPLNKRRNIALALGLGYEYSDVYTDVLALRQGANTQYYLSDQINTDYSYPGFYTHSVEIPFEFRYRGSTASSYKFYRFYTGLKFSYVWSMKSFYQFQGMYTSYSNSQISDSFQYKAYCSLGYNTWNIFIQYVFSPFFKQEVSTDQKSLKMNMLQIGLIFYIL